MKPSTAEKIALYIVKWGIFAVLLLPLYISSGLLFPFITGKNFIFQIVIELIFPVWVGLAVLSPAYRPRPTKLFKAATLFILILFLADLFSPNPYRSFFSNYERMEGFVMLGHLYLYLVMMLGMLKSKKDWAIYFHTTLIASIAVGIIALLQKAGFRVSLQGGYRVDSTIGNPAYLAAYLSFHVGILALLIRQHWNVFWRKYLYGVGLAYEILIIYFTATRGTSIALFVGVLVFAAIAIFAWEELFSRHLSARKYAVGTLVVLILIPVLFWQIRHTNLIPQNSAFSRLASISLQDRTTQARFSIWNMSLQGVLERPILGWGQENYYLVFQKYYDPKLYASEPWFDRSHNIVFDWLIHAGILGLFAFFSMLAAAVWGIILAMRRRTLSAWDGLIIATMFLVYLIQNIFVFDNLNTYLLFFGFLAYADLVSVAAPSENPKKEQRKYGIAAGATVALVCVVIVFANYLHIKPIRQSGALIDALLLDQKRVPEKELEDGFKRALSFNSFGTTEVREQIGNAAREVLASQRWTSEDRDNFAAFAIGELEKEIDRPSKDVKHMIFLASILDRAAGHHPEYLGRAEKIMKEAIDLAPRKQMLYFELAQVYLLQGRSGEAIDLMKKTVELEPSYQNAAINLLLIGQMANRPDAVKQALHYIDVKSIADEDMLKRLGTIYQQSENWDGALAVFTRLTEMNPKSVPYHATAAALLAHAGQFDRAIEEARKAAELDPQFAKEAEIFIKQIEAQKDKK